MPVVGPGLCNTSRSRFIQTTLKVYGVGRRSFGVESVCVRVCRVRLTRAVFGVCVCVCGSTVLGEVRFVWVEV